MYLLEITTHYAVMGKFVGLQSTGRVKKNITVI